MAGSYTIFSVPRSAMILQPASDDIEDNHVVFSPVKNNDGEMGKRTAWERRDGTFIAAEHFDWNEFSTAYDALKTINGRFSVLLRRRDDGTIGLADAGD